MITWRREIERYIFPQVHRVHPEGGFETNLHGHLIHSKLAVKKITRVLEEKSPQLKPLWTMNVCVKFMKSHLMDKGVTVENTVIHRLSK